MVTVAVSKFSFVVRLEVQADVQKERCSLSGESGTVSLGTISDNASTKAMAGSILNAYMPLDRCVFMTFFKRVTVGKKLALTLLVIL